MVKIEGNCDERYESVRRHFEQMVNSGCEDKAQLCVYVEGECVIDLHATYQDDPNYGPDNIQVHLYALGRRARWPCKSLF